MNPYQDRQKNGASSLVNHGSTSGFGLAFVHHLLSRGDKVIATARNTSKIAHLQDLGASTLKLDLADDQSTLNDQAKAAIAVHRRIDILVNNARYAHFGTVEEDTRDDWINQFQTHVFGPLAVTRVFLPQLRKQRSGTIVFMGSTAAWFPTLGAYCSSKAALPALIETLHAELSPFNIRTLLIEPAFFKTSLLALSNTHFTPPTVADFVPLTSETYSKFKSAHDTQPNGPEKGVNRIVDVVKGEGGAEGKEFSRRLVLGRDAVEEIRGRCEGILGGLREWEGVSNDTEIETEIFECDKTEFGRTV
ncbi:oxidoreductase,short chain dehydrogenase-like protein [Rhexocercosporidium sp. MPI-PUGE-AT-0058]|nr:oxidoreductase,short chain dehydrogenase-like protein [Rhexocercosporidium sp. MPI-PUGE-AT-0058]